MDEKMAAAELREMLLVPLTAMNVKVYPRRKPIKPGARMAGGLIGALAGGALGAGTAELVKRESPAARLIAKIQTQGGRLNPQDHNSCNHY